MRRWFASLVVALCLVVPLKGGDAGIKTERSLVYGKGGNIELELDLAMPEGKGPYPAVVCIHGGGWRSGNRDSLLPLTQQLAKKGFVAVTLSYRLVPDAVFPAQIEDCKAAVRWLRANADKYQVRSDRIGAIGFSAGGHLACLLGAADESAGLEGKGGNPKQSSRIQAVISFFGPTDLTSRTWNPDVEKKVLSPFLGGSYEKNIELYRKASPITYVSKDAPPFLFFHGTKDALVGIDHSRKMLKKLTEVGVPAELVTMEGEGHGWPREKMVQTLEQSIRFFQEKLKNERAQSP